MTDPETASENLRVIRSLMERATVYRAISAPAALFGGTLAVLTGGWMAWQSEAAGWAQGIGFYIVWVAILAVGGVFNGWLLWKDAGSRGEPFISAGMRHAMKAIVPPMLTGGILSHAFLHHYQSTALCAVTWVICYGLALLATAGFAPRSVSRLGCLFLSSGLLAVIAGYFLEWRASAGTDLRAAGIVMVCTFGFLHIAYAVRILSDRRHALDAAAA